MNPTIKFGALLAAFIFLMYIFAVPTLTSWLGPIAGSYASGAAVALSAFVSFFVLRRFAKQHD